MAGGHGVAPEIGQPKVNGLASGERSPKGGGAAGAENGQPPAGGARSGDLNDPLFIGAGFR